MNKRQPISYYAERDGVELKRARNCCRRAGIKDDVTGWRLLTDKEWQAAMKPKTLGRPIKCYNFKK